MRNEDGKRKLRVLALIWSMGDGGAQQVLLNHLRAFSGDDAIDFHAAVFCGPQENRYCEEIRRNGYPVDFLGNPRSRLSVPFLRWPLNRLAARRAWERYLRDFQPDAVHVHISGLLADVLVPVCRAGIPLRFDSLHSSPYRYRGRELRAIQRAFQRERFVGLCLNERQAAQAAEYYGMRRFEILHNGIDMAAIRSRLLPRAEARRSLGLPEEACVLAGVGRLDPVKNYPFMLAVFREVRRRREDALLVIAGDGPERERLRELARELGLEQAVRFLGNRRDVVPVYCAADHFLMTSDSEASPLALLEAQCCGAHCVVSEGVPEESVISDGVYRFVSGEMRPERWAEAVLGSEVNTRPRFTAEDYDIRTAAAQLRRCYLKHWEEYQRRRELAE